MKSFTRTTIASVILAGSSVSAHAGLITFESLNAQPAGTVVKDQFQASDGVRFRGVGDPGVGGVNIDSLPGVFLGKRGGTFDQALISGDFGGLEGWQYPNGSIFADDFFGTQGAFAGQNFITDVMGSDNGGTATLNVFYDTAVADFSFDIYDVDTPNVAAETYTISYYRDLGQTDLVGSHTVTAGDPDTGDGYSTRTGFDGDANEIVSLRIVGTATGATLFGLGFDNFATDTFIERLPVPAPFALIAGGLLGLSFARKVMPKR
jgi:hypothetical protein